LVFFLHKKEEKKSEREGKRGEKRKYRENKLNPLSLSSFPIRVSITTTTNNRNKENNYKQCGVILIFTT